jgi:transglutaminase-like putative cysteine protease
VRLLGRDPELAGWHLSAGRLAWLSVSLLLVVLPHLPRLPAWVPGLFTALCAWRLWRVRRGDDRPPPRWLTATIALAALAAVYASFGTVTGRQAGVALLTVLAGVKLVETRGLRDCYVLSYLGFFLVVTNFLFAQDMLTGAYMVLVVLVMTATLHALGFSPGNDPAMAVGVHLRRAATLMLQSVPLMLVLFALFPRIPGPLWGLPRDAHAGLTGLSDDMSPGAISALSQSDAVAFRVRFDGPIPESGRLYWRGPVLTHTDGWRWTRDADRRLARRSLWQPLGPAVDYEITLEPHGGRWLVALDPPAFRASETWLTEDIEIRARRDVTDRLRYRMRSHLDYRLARWGPHDPAAVLALPPGWHPRARALGLAWRQELGDAWAVAERALRWFREEPFRYTLRPALLAGDPVDEFLFSTREGFCEHYASAFVVLMRAAGVPARVVTGYQGGEINPIGDYLLVRQRDAHAWAEIWLRGEGWVRMDPTAAVSPLRVEGGIDAAIPPTLGPPALGLAPAPSLADALRRLRQAVDAVQASWNTWILGYGPQRQRQALERIGLDASRTSTLVLALGVAAAAVLSLLAAWMFLGRARRDPVRASYDRFCARLARHGLERHPGEGPRDYARRVCAARPDLAAAVAAITEDYVALRYAGGGGDAARLRRAVGAFRP